MNSLKTRREKLPWPSDRPFKVLALDGGGIRGLYAATLLMIAERELAAPDSLICDYFDMITGTSTGGIIAIGLGLRKTTSEIQKLYAVDGKRVFPPFWAKHPWLAMAVRAGGPLHNHRVLEQLLYNTFGDATLGSSSTRLAIPAFKGPKTEIAVFKTDHHPDFKNDWKTYAWEIARATSAAPTYLAGHEGDGYVFLDGGLWANNPIMVALVDILSAYDVDREQIEVLSIGTGNPPFDIGAFAAKGGLWRWRNIVEGAMFLTTDNAAAQAALLLGPDKILRLEPDGSAASIALDDWMTAKELLPELARSDFLHRKVDISKFFTSKAAPRDRFYT